MVSSAKDGYRIVTRLRVPAAKEPLHVALANLHEDEASLRRWRKQWGHIIESDKAKTLGLSVTGPEITVSVFDVDPLTRKFRGPLSREFILQRWLREAWCAERDAIQFLQRSIAEDKGSWEFQAGRIELVPTDLWTTVCIMFLQDRNLGKIARCKRKDCSSLYFRRNRKTQIYCSDVCQHAALLEQKRHWWNTNRATQVTKLG